MLFLQRAGQRQRGRAHVRTPRAGCGHLDLRGLVPKGIALPEAEQPPGRAEYSGGCGRGTVLFQPSGKEEDKAIAMPEDCWWMPRHYLWEPPTQRNPPHSEDRERRPQRSQTQSADIVTWLWVGETGLSRRPSF